MPRRIKRNPPGVRSNYAFICSEKNNRLNRHRRGAASINPQRPFFPSIIARLPFHTSGSRLPFARRIAPRRQLCAVLFTFDPPTSLADLTPFPVPPPCPRYTATDGNPYSRGCRPFRPPPARSPTLSSLTSPFLCGRSARVRREKSRRDRDRNSRE